MAARMANDREVVDAQPRMTPAPAPTRSFGTPVMEDMDEAEDLEEASSFAPAGLAERDLAAMDLPDLNLPELNLDDLDAQGEWNASATGTDADAEPDNFLPPEADSDDV
jgi:hypothetical protein